MKVDEIIKGSDIPVKEFDGIIIGGGGDGLSEQQPKALAAADGEEAGQSFTGKGPPISHS